MKITALIIAAGYSSRMKSFKPLLPFADKSALELCVNTFQEAGVDNIIVVTGHNHEVVEQEAKRIGVQTIHNHNFDQGMFSSIQRGVEALDNCDGFFMLPVDIPLIRSVTIKALIDNFSESKIVSPTFQTTAGHPPLIPILYKDKILNHDGDGGLHKLLSSLPNIDVPVWDQATLMDMDTQKDYNTLQNHYQTRTVGTKDEAMEIAKLLMPERGIDHGIAAAERAIKIGTALNFNNRQLDIVHNAALLHDIGKGSPDHEKEGAKILRDYGLTSLAPCVENHMEINYQDKLEEIEVVYLADKLVRGSKPVSIEKRFQQKLGKYKDDKDACIAINRRLEKTLVIKNEVEKACNKSIDEIIK